MNDSAQQGALFDFLQGASSSKVLETPAEIWEKDSAKRALDELFNLACQYKSSASYWELMKFIRRFKFYSPFNAMLVHVQLPGATFVATPNRWYRDYRRHIMSGARPLVLLQPMGPVMFVFDVSDTEPSQYARPLPPEIENPFEVRGGVIGTALERLIENAKRDGIRIMQSQSGSQSAGSIRQVAPGVSANQSFSSGWDKKRNPKVEKIPVRYDLLTNGRLSREAQYATIVHELAHLYCGHLGTPDDKWWPDRRGLEYDVGEFEAESVAYLVCCRVGIDTPSEEYLSGFVEKQNEVPQISLDCVMKAAGLIETMSHQKMKLRKKTESA